MKLKKTVSSKSIWNTGLELAVAAVLTTSLGVSAHAQSSNLAADATTPAVSSSASSSTDAATPAAPTSAADAPAAQTVSPQRGWGLGYRQDPVNDGNKGYFHTHGFDLAGSGTGRYQTSVTHQSPYLAGNTEGVGFLANIREHPTSWFGLELNYGYNKYSEHYRVTAEGGPVTSVQLEQHEATAGYVFHIKTPWVQPFVVLGGGGIDFRPTPSSSAIVSNDQWRGAAMYEVGLDFVSKRQPHVGFRLQEHGLFYKAPDFYVASFRSNGWVHQASPAAGVFYRF